MSGSESSSSSDSDSNIGPTPTHVFSMGTLTKVKLPEHIAAYLEKRELVRDYEAVPCESELAEKVMLNYIIAKRILSNMSWQDKLLCQNVCTTWRSAIKALAKERLDSVDFEYNCCCRYPRLSNAEPFLQSDKFYNEPLAVLSFVNVAALSKTLNCKDLSHLWPVACKPVCEDKSHAVLDLIHQLICGPKSCMLTAVASAFTYLPVSQVVIERYNTAGALFRKASYCNGIVLPCIPGVEFHVLNIKQEKQNTMDLKRDFFDKVDQLSHERIFKGAVVFVTEKYILQSVEDMLLLNYMKKVQPDIPYALGGCLVEDTLYGEKEIEALVQEEGNYTSKNFISVVLFTVPKVEDIKKEKCNFEMYSLIIESSEWTKEKIKQSINEFAKRVPRFEYSAALKLSCVGRDRKHMQEQSLFRLAFPNTPIVGCYGNGELGVNHPPRTPPGTAAPPSQKRPKLELNSMMFSYSTVFMYMGWGKIIAEPEAPKKK